MLNLPFDLERSIEINKPVADVFNAVRDFNSWPKWSPWLCMEPSCSFKASGSPGQAGHQQEWDGKLIGSGRMELTTIKDQQSLGYDLFFLKPWKSHSKVEFTFSQEGGATKVTWSMQGTVPVFLFFMRNMMSGLVGADYERGLRMLKEFVEDGKVLSRVDVKEEAAQGAFYYLGQHRHCSFENIGPKMKEDFDKLGELSHNGSVPKPDFVFAAYHEYDFANRKCEYTCGFGYHSAPDAAASGLSRGQVDNHRALRVDHTGRYQHLGNGWSTVMSMQRSQKKKVLKSVPMYEIYKNMPGEVAESELKTEIYLPIK